MSGLEHLGRSGRPEPATPAGAPAGRAGGAQVSYGHDDFGDWSHLAPEVAAAVAPHLAGDRLGGWVNKTTTRRRGDDYYQSCTAWWSSALMVVEIAATRPLVSAGGNRFRPSGAWAGDAVVHRLAPSPVAAKTWARRPRASADGSGPAPPPRLVHDSLELLPEPLRRLTAGGPPAGSLLWDHGHGQVTEEVMAFRVMDGKAVVLVAWRGPCEREGRESAVWHSRLVETGVVDTKAHSFGTRASPSSPASSDGGPTLPPAGRRGLPRS